LLVKNRLQKRLEGRRRWIQPQHERSGPLDQRAQLRIVSVQMRQGLVNVERKFAAAPVMNHKGIVYRAVRVSAYFSWILAILCITVGRTT